MTYASASFGGAATPTYLTSTITATDMTATFHDLTDWVEVDSTGAATTQPLGTSGPFCIKLSWGTAHEETVQCSGLDPLTGVITFAQRGFDGTTAQAHTASTKANCFPTDTATDWINVHDAISTAVADSADALALAQTADSNASDALSEASSALSAANSKVASVTAADGTITVAGTSTAPTVKVGTVPYGQVSGTPTSLPPSGSAGGDLTGTYPSPTLAALSPSPAGTYGSTTKMPVITVDAKGRITSASEATPATDAPSGPAGGDLSGTYPNPSVVAGSTTVAGKLQLTDSTSSTSTTTAATPNAVKSAYDLASTANTAAGAAQTTANAKVASVTAGDSTVTVGGTTTAPTVAVNQANLVIAESQVTNLTNDLAAKAPTSRTISTTAPLAGGGDLSANRTLSIADASTTAKGAVQLTDGVASTSTTTAATPNGVKTAYDAATTAQTTANAAAPKTTTISTTAPLSGGGDLSANRTLSIADATTSVKGAVQLTDSTSSTSLTTAATPNSVKTAYDLAFAALPKSGGTMSGRIQNLSLPGAATDPARAGDFGATVPPSLHGLTAWTYDPGAFAGGTLTLATGVCYFTAIYVPYAMTVSKIWGFINTGGIAATSGTILNMGLYNSTTLLASTGNQSAFIGVTGAAGFSLTSPYAIATPGVYWIGLLYVQGTGGTPSAPTWQKGGQTTNTIVNMNVANSNTSLLNQRAASSASRTALPTDLTALSNITFNQHLMLMGLS